jgi:hypothetical protein
MSEAHAFIRRMPFALSIWTSRLHVIPDPGQFLPVHGIGRDMIGVDASDAAHECVTTATADRVKSHPICKLTNPKRSRPAKNAGGYFFVFQRSKSIERIKGEPPHRDHSDLGPPTGLL